MRIREIAQSPDAFGRLADFTRVERVAFDRMKLAAHHGIQRRGIALDVDALDKDFQRVLTMLESGAIDPAPWITHHTDPDHIVAEFSGWLNPANNVIKAVLEF